MTYVVFACLKLLWTGEFSFPRASELAGEGIEAREGRRDNARLNTFKRNSKFGLKLEEAAGPALVRHTFLTPLLYGAATVKEARPGC